METIFKMKTIEEATFISKPKLFTKKKKQENYQYKKDAYWIEVPIVNKQDEILRTIERHTGKYLFRSRNKRSNKKNNN